MDVEIINRDTWEGLHRLVMTLWLIVPLALVFGISILLSMAIIPSLISTRELPPWSDRHRAPLYALALISGVALVVIIVAVILATGVIGEFWPRWAM